RADREYERAAPAPTHPGRQPDDGGRDRDLRERERRPAAPTEDEVEKDLRGPLPSGPGRPLVRVRENVAPGEGETRVDGEAVTRGDHRSADAHTCPIAAPIS